MSIMTCDKLVVLNVIGDLCWVVLIVIGGVDCNYNWVSLMILYLLTLRTIMTCDQVVVSIVIGDPVLGVLIVIGGVDCNWVPLYLMIL